MQIANLTTLILNYVAAHTAGSPTDPAIKWTHLKPSEITRYLLDLHGLTISNMCVKRVLKANGYVRRKPLKVIEAGKSPHKEAQFLMICFFTKLFIRMKHNPMISIDKKETEELGNLTRNEALLCENGTPVETFSHDYTHLATGKAIPLGIFDIKRNKGYITLGDSRETADFLFDNLLYWWENYGKIDYPDADNILIFCDGGGANGYRHHRFKQRLQDLAKIIGIRITVVHYPPYCSKYNPIEHRLFCHVELTLKGTILTDLDQMKMLIEKTYTKTGLTVEVRIWRHNYETKMPSDPKLINQNRICYANNLPQFNYLIKP